jgi:hypothetical protein
LLLEVLRKVRPVLGVQSLEALGERHLEAVSYRTKRGERRIPADQLLIHQGVVPSLNLALLAGCSISYADDQACFQVETDPWGVSHRRNISVAGDGAWIYGDGVDGALSGL